MPLGHGSKLSAGQLCDFEFHILRREQALVRWMFEGDGNHVPTNKERRDRIRSILESMFPTKKFGETYIRKLFNAMKHIPAFRHYIDKEAWEKSFPRTCSLPPGKYIICDPCYIIPSAQWGKYLDCAFGYDGGGPSIIPGTFTALDVQLGRWSYFDWPLVDGSFQKTAVFSTVHGDGSYPCEYGDNVFYCGVDAGIIAFTPANAELSKSCKLVDYVSGKQGAEYVDAPYGIAIEYDMVSIRFSFKTEDGCLTRGIISLK